MSSRRRKKSAPHAGAFGRPHTFTLVAPTAKKVFLAGEFTAWQEAPISMERDSVGIWRCTVALPAGAHQYRFVVDGEWVDDPDCALRAPNPHGGQNSVLEVSG